MLIVGLAPGQTNLPRSVTVRCASGPMPRVDVVVAARDPVRNLRSGTERILLLLVVATWILLSVAWNIPCSLAWSQISTRTWRPGIKTRRSSASRGRA